MQEIVDDVNRDRVRVEQIKRFAILPRDFSQEEGELTPTLKLRRKVVHEHFAAEIDGLRTPVTAGFLVASAFLASAVEFVEALTIVLAAGITRGWRSSLTGLAAATRRARGDRRRARPGADAHPDRRRCASWSAALLLVFGLQWLRKAILRASGYKALHDEDAIFARELAEARAAGSEERAGLDWYGFTLAFKGVLLEGLEVAFIVITFGSAQGSIGLAALGAGIALVLVAIVGVLVRAPLARVPENTLKFAVGVMLTTFGIFWSAEGAGAHWPGDDASLPGVLAFVVLALVRRRRRCSSAGGSRSHEAPPRVRPLLVGLRRRRRLAGRRRRRARARRHRRARRRRRRRLVADAGRGRGAPLLSLRSGASSASDSPGTDVRVGVPAGQRARSSRRRPCAARG